MQGNSQKILAWFVVIFGLVSIFLFFYFYFGNLFRKNLSSQEKVSLPGPLKSKKAENLGQISDKEVIRITNEYREKEGLEPLIENQKLNEAALKRAEDMFERQYFAHVAPDGSDVSDTLRIVKYEYAATGENLALGYFKDSKDLVDAWMASPGHRENILKKNFTEIGVAHKVGIFEGKRQLIAVQVFGKPLSACQMPDSNLKSQIDSKKNYIENLKAQIENLDKEIKNLEAEIQNLVTQINSLYSESNNLIKKGNQVYRETGDRSLAEKYWSEGETKRALADQKKKELDSLQAELESKVETYNNLVGKVQKEESSLESLILKYNSQVDAFNRCVKE